MKYTIVHVNDRAKENMDYNKSVLKDYEYVQDIEFFNGNTGNSWDVINHYKIRQDVWAPYDGRTAPPLPGELGIWISTLNVWKYMIDNNVDSLLMLEDDVRLHDSFVENLKLCVADLPDNFDFLSLYYFSEHNWEDDLTDIGSKYIHRSTNQFSAGQATLYSLSGARKMLRAVTRKGIEYTADCFIFEQARRGVVNGYSLRPDKLVMLSHEFKSIQSLIDPDNIRNTDAL